MICLFLPGKGPTLQLRSNSNHTKQQSHSSASTSEQSCQVPGEGILPPHLQEQRCALPSLPPLSCPCLAEPAQLQLSNTKGLAICSHTAGNPLKSFLPPCEIWYLHTNRVEIKVQPSDQLSITPSIREQ